MDYGAGDTLVGVCLGPGFRLARQAVALTGVTASYHGVGELANGDEGRAGKVS